MTWEEQLVAAQRRMRATGGPTTPRRRPRPHRGRAQLTERDVQRTLARAGTDFPTADEATKPVVGPLQGHRTRPTERDRRRTLLRLAGPPTEAA